jgi:hypothetical protein
MAAAPKKQPSPRLKTDLEIVRDVIASIREGISKIELTSINLQALFDANSDVLRDLIYEINRARSCHEFVLSHVTISDRVLDELIQALIASWSFENISFSDLSTGESAREEDKYYTFALASLVLNKHALKTYSITRCPVFSESLSRLATYTLKRTFTYDPFTVLTLNDMGEFTEDVIKDFCATLENAKSPLKSLDLSNNVSIGTHGVASLLSACSKSTCNLRKLRVSNTKLDWTACAHISAFLRSNPFFEELDVSNNKQLGTDVNSYSDMIRALAVNTHLHVLDLGTTGMPKRAMKLLISIVRDTNRTLIHVNTDGNPAVSPKNRKIFYGEMDGRTIVSAVSTKYQRELFAICKRHPDVYEEVDRSLLTDEQLSILDAFHNTNVYHNQFKNLAQLICAHCAHELSADSLTQPLNTLHAYRLVCDECPVDK